VLRYFRSRLRTPSAGSDSPPPWLSRSPASEPLRRAIFGTTSSIFDLCSRPWGVARLLDLRGVPPRPHPLEGVGSSTTTIDMVCWCYLTLFKAWKRMNVVPKETDWEIHNRQEWIGLAKGVGRKIFQEGEASEKRPKNSTIKPLPREGGAGPTEKKTKK